MPLEIRPLAIPDVMIITAPKFGDARGYFSEVYNSASFAEAGLSQTFVQDNHSWSAKAGTLRGLHYQSDPFAQGKLVRVVRGRILDVAVDLRAASSHFGKWVCAELSAENRSQIWVPPGFAHGFCTLEDNTEVIYKVTQHYAPKHDHGLIWNDPDIGIDWPVSARDVILSPKDMALPQLCSIAPPFA
jgi:dTDP-4-dehydrorhamnose 3,5-epimerase